MRWISKALMVAAQFVEPAAIGARVLDAKNDSPGCDMVPTRELRRQSTICPSIGARKVEHARIDRRLGAGHREQPLQRHPAEREIIAKPRRS